MRGVVGQVQKERLIVVPYCVANITTGYIGESIRGVEIVCWFRPTITIEQAPIPGWLEVVECTRDATKIAIKLPTISLMIPPMIILFFRPGLKPRLIFAILM